MPWWDRLNGSSKENTQVSERKEWSGGVLIVPPRCIAIAFPKCLCVDLSSVPFCNTPVAYFDAIRAFCEATIQKRSGKSVLTVNGSTSRARQGTLRQY